MKFLTTLPIGFKLRNIQKCDILFYFDNFKFSSTDNINAHNNNALNILVGVNVKQIHY